MKEKGVNLSSLAAQLAKEDLRKEMEL